VIDGFVAAGDRQTAHYMEWMGRLPMLAHPAPRRALVIGFGIGHTANGVRREGAADLALDIARDEVLEGWIASLDEKPTLAAICQRLIEYATYDA